MKVVKKIIIQGEEEVFSPIQGDPNEPFEIIGTGEIPIEDSDFIPVLQEEEVPQETEIPEGPTGPPGPQGDTGPQGPAGGGTAELWDSEIPTLATNFTGIPQGTVIPVGSSSIDILKSMLYPITISFTSFNMFANPTISRLYHVGNSIPSNTYEASWNLNGASNALPNSLRIVTGTTTLFTGNPTDINAIITHGPYSRTAEGNVTFTVSVTGSYNDTISRSDTYSWRFPLYAGKKSGTTISNTEISSLAISSTEPSGVNPFINFTLTNMRNGITLSFPSSSNTTYLFWLVPKAISGPSSVTNIANYPQYNPANSFSDVTNPNTPITVPMTGPFSLTATNYGVSIVFDTYRSLNDFAGARTIKAQQ